jgi:hypothetical protein
MIGLKPAWTSKNPGPENQALVIPRGDLLCCQRIDQLKFQITNPNDQNSKIQTMFRPEKLM